MQVAAVNSRKSMLPPLGPSQVSYACAKYTLVCETSYLHSMCIPSTQSHWLICSRRRSSFLRIMTYVRTSPSLLMVPHLNSVVFRCKTTMWSCLFGTSCSHVCSITSSCFGACYCSSSLENLANFISSVCVANFLFRHAESEVSYHQSDLNLRQIWWLEHSQQLHFVPSLHCRCANFPWAALLRSCCPRSSSKVDIPWVPSISDDKKNHPLRCLQQGSPHHPSPSMPFYRTPPNDRSRFSLGWFKEFQWSLNQR